MGAHLRIARNRQLGQVELNEPPLNPIALIAHYLPPWPNVSPTIVVRSPSLSRPRRGYYLSKKQQATPLIGGITLEAAYYLTSALSQLKFWVK